MAGLLLHLECVLLGSLPHPDRSRPSHSISEIIENEVPVEGANSFHEKAGERQGFSFIFVVFFLFFISSFSKLLPFEPSRLCRHPSIRTLC